MPPAPRISRSSPNTSATPSRATSAPPTVDEQNILRVVTVSPQLEREVLDAIGKAPTGEYIPVLPERADEIADLTARAVQPLVLAGHEPIVLTSAPIRRFFKRIVERRVPKIVALSYNEIDPAVQLEGAGQVEG
jgi:flagellar biosynthesis protein FlhA